MHAEQIRQLEPKFDRFLGRFADCFARKDTRAHLGIYVRGQLANLPEKSVEPITLEAGVAPRTLQEFLSQLQCDQERLRDRVQEIVRNEHAETHTLGIFEETSDFLAQVRQEWGEKAGVDGVPVPCGKGCIDLSRRGDCGGCYCRQRIAWKLKPADLVARR